MVAQLEHTAAQVTDEETVRPYRFSVDDYHRLIEGGFLTKYDRVELIEGELIVMSPIGRRHAACVNRLTDIFGRVRNKTFILSVQNPLLLSESNSEPQPDVMLLKPRADFYEQVQPQPADVLLLIEVSDTTLIYDRTVKLPLYARHEVPEAWIVNLAQNTIEIYTEPKNGIYTLQRIAQRGEKIAPRQFQNINVKVDFVLG